MKYKYYPKHEYLDGSEYKLTVSSEDKIGMDVSNELNALDKLLKQEETIVRTKYHLSLRYTLENSVEEEFKRDKCFEKQLSKNILLQIPDSYLEKAVSDPQLASRAHLFYENHNQGDLLTGGSSCLDVLRHKSTIENAIYDHTNMRIGNLLENSNNLENPSHHSSENHISLPKHALDFTPSSASEKSKQESIITDEKMRNVMDNTALVKSLLDSFKNPSIPASQSLGPPPNAPVIASRYEGDKYSTQQNHQSREQGEINNNANIDLLNKMKNFSNVMQDLLSSMKPYLEQQKNVIDSPNTSSSSTNAKIILPTERQYIPNNSSSGQSQKQFPKLKKQRSQSQTRQQSKSSRYQNTNELYQESYNANKKNNNVKTHIQNDASAVSNRGHKRVSESNERGKPKALKRMQKIAKEHNL